MDKYTKVILTIIAVCIVNITFNKLENMLIDLDHKRPYEESSRWEKPE